MIFLEGLTKFKASAILKRQDEKFTGKEKKMTKQDCDMIAKVLSEAFEVQGLSYKNPEKGLYVYNQIARDLTNAIAGCCSDEILSYWLDFIFSK